jgi:hypothetical protein
MQVETATPSAARVVDASQLLAGAKVRLRLWLLRFRENLLLDLLEILEPQRTFGK